MDDNSMKVLHSAASTNHEQSRIPVKHSYCGRTTHAIYVRILSIVLDHIPARYLMGFPMTISLLLPIQPCVRSTVDLDRCR